ncbi:hypothetical protein [Clostridium sp.]|uniref:hypothetical protein n=1 Tax=Clostridium sp. TaxID=1506 RepID=UPI003216D3EC
MKSSEVKVDREYIFSKNEDTSRAKRRKGRVLAETEFFFLVKYKNGRRECFNKCDINCGYIAVKECRR